MNTPWGTSDHSSPIAKGVTFYGTPSHGGAKVSASQNKKIPLVFRNEDGWYEEDLDITLVLYFLYNELVCEKRAKEDMLDTIRTYFPAKFTVHFGQDISEQVREDAKKKSWIKDVDAEVELYRQQVEQLKKKRPFVQPKPGDHIIFDEPVDYGDYEIKTGKIVRYKKKAIAIEHEGKLFKVPNLKSGQYPHQIRAGV